MTGAVKSPGATGKSRKAPLGLKIFQLVLWLSVVGAVVFFALRGPVLAPPASGPAATGELIPGASSGARFEGDVGQGGAPLGQADLATAADVAGLRGPVADA